MKNIKFELTSFHLHIIAMALMLCDHLWVTLVPGNDWLTDIGRIAFPIFAFMTVEGFFHTKDLKKYVKRLLFFALISEIPFNLVVAGSVFYPLHQNVLWTFLIGIGLMWINEQAKDKKAWVRFLVGIGTVLMGFIIGLITFVDYHYAGVMTVLAFYFFRGRNWKCFLAQLLCLIYINAEILSGYEYVFEFFGREWHILRQSFAILAIIPIWLYRGKQGYYNRAVKELYYCFYPAHLIILWLIRQIIY